MPYTRSPVARCLPLFVATLATLGASFAAQADATLNKIEQRHRVVVGVLLSCGPFGSIDPTTQKPKGMNVDLAEDVGRQLGAEVELVPVLPANRVQFLQQGKVDLLIANMEWTAERGQQLGFVPTPFYRVGGTAAVLKDSKITRWEDLSTDPESVARLRKVYRTVDEVDTMVGLFAETPPEGFGFSDTAFRIFILMASRRLQSDRFLTVDFRPEVYTPLGMDWIARSGMRDVILRHAPDLAAAIPADGNPFAPWKEQS